MLSYGRVGMVLAVTAAAGLGLWAQPGAVAETQPPGHGHGPVVRFQFTQIAGGGDHTCGLVLDDGVWCWGANNFGQLGNGTDTASATPVAVAGLSGRGSGVTAITAGRYFSCALTSGGAAMCWGADGDGQLGNAANTASNIPVAVSGLGSGVTAISAGRFHACAVTTAGAAMCWGADGGGQLGNGANTASNVPVPVTGLSSGVTAITAGSFQSCAAATGGAAMCWGSNQTGELGNGTFTASNTPVAVSGLGEGVTAISSNSGHTCAVAGGGVQCWGVGGFGQLGDATFDSSNVPVPVSGLSSGVGAITTGFDHSCAIVTGGAAMCWGGNVDGQLGDAGDYDSNVPVAVTGLSSAVSAISAGGEHTCAITPGAAGARCWGANVFGQLGDGTTTGSDTAVAVSR
jgi:alpha-tubulin suppressor-like RCC1 family protein